MRKFSKEWYRLTLESRIESLEREYGFAMDNGWDQVTRKIRNKKMEGNPLTYEQISDLNRAYGAYNELLSLFDEI